jgi:GNAT superfamily N-acetyltransferase
MSYAQIDISEVGPAEYPLINVLRDTIFGEFNHRYAATFDEVIEGKQDVLALIAHLEGNPVGYKIGYRERPRQYLSWTGGVLPDYRGQGIARRMQDWQHAWLRARGYTSVAFNSFNKFRAMVTFGLASGFVPDAVNIRPENELSIHFTKDLTAPEPPRREKLPPAEVHVESVGPDYHGLIAQMISELLEPTTEAELDREMDAPDALALVAFVDGKPVGFKAGRGRDKRRRLFESRTGGVLPGYRDRGVATALAEHQIRVVERLGYRAIQTNAKNHNTPQILMQFKLGFNLCGLTFNERRQAALVVMERQLGGGGTGRGTPA